MGDNSPELDEEYRADRQRRRVSTTTGRPAAIPAGISTQDEELAARLDPVVAGRRVANYLRVLTLEAQTLARACGKSHVHNLEPEDLVALTVEAAAMARVPLAGTNWIPGNVSFLLPCPHCGPRDVNEFRYQGEVTRRPPPEPTLRELTDYVYFRDNVAGVQREWWYHRVGCGIWFLAERDTRTNEVLRTEIPPPRRRGMRLRLRSRASGSTARGTSRFFFDGEPVDAFAGDTIGSALFASGRRVFSRSFKYHRPRGLLCCSGSCANCMMTVDGVPNVRVCVEPVRAGRAGEGAERPRLARPRSAQRSSTRSAGRSRRSASTTAR